VASIGTPASEHSDRGTKAVSRASLQRRPTGSPPPLPRPIGATAKVWLALVGAIAVLSALLLRNPTVLRVVDHIDAWWLRLLAEHRTAWLTTTARAIKAAGSGWGVTGLGLALVAALMALRRWRHLLVFLASLWIMHALGGAFYLWLTRPRPYDVTIIDGWGGFSIPSAPVALLTAVLVGIAYTLVVAGRPRTYAKLWIVGIVGVVILAREYLGVDHPGDALYAVVFAVAISVTAYRFFTPNEVFPVVYRRGRTAHLDVTGRRADAIRRAVKDQLGLEVIDIKPFGLEGSGGSTPLRLTVHGATNRYVFAKLYAKNHVRADRWYKLGRTILYGGLEDETSFQTVRRFVEYEDYTLRLLYDAGIPVPRPYGIVEITPEREYLIAMEFFKGAVEIGEVEIDEPTVDDGLMLIRKLWDAGVAHRDIKPANLMVRDGRVLLIDVFFVQVRPSPWRQAVDLGNMMLVLALRSDPVMVYERALRLFTPEEISEAFAATRGVASPTQVRASMKKDPRDLLGTFRGLAPPRLPISIQRWSVRRVALAVGALVVLALAVVGGVQELLPEQNPGIPGPPDCTGNAELVLSAQAVPSAALLPCLASLPSGWSYGGGDFHTGVARFWLDSDRAGTHAVTVTLTDSCSLEGAQRVPSDEDGTVRYEAPVSLAPTFVDIRTYVFPGGCATYAFAFAPGAPSTLAIDADGALSFTPRAVVVQAIERTENLTLCGQGAPPCPD
jgi:tRNA A-37 threonylcarbamoyl transferase component Bud32